MEFLHVFLVSRESTYQAEESKKTREFTEEELNRVGGQFIIILFMSSFTWTALFVKIKWFYYFGWKRLLFFTSCTRVQERVGWWDWEWHRMSLGQVGWVVGMQIACICWLLTYLKHVCLMLMSCKWLLSVVTIIVQNRKSWFFGQNQTESKSWLSPPPIRFCAPFFHHRVQFFNTDKTSRKSSRLDISKPQKIKTCDVDFRAIRD